MYTKEEINVLSAVTEINHNMDALIGAVNDLNIMSMKIVAEKDPENVTKEMILALASNGIDVRDLNDYFKNVLPECLEIAGADKSQEPQFIKVKVKKKRAAKREPEKKSESERDETLQLREDVKPIAGVVPAQSVKDAVPPTGRRYTGNIVHGDDKKRGVIFAKCNKSPEIENRVVDVLIQAANDRNIMIQEFIVNEKDGMNKLKAWMESEMIDYVIMNNLDEYSQYPVTQFYFLDEAYRCGVKVLLKDNDFNPVFPF